MTRARSRLIVLDLLVAVSVSVALWVGLKGPIKIPLRARELSCGSPGRPLLIAGSLLLIRLLSPLLMRGWRRVGPPILGRVRRPYVWLPALLLVLSIWPYSRYQAYRHEVVSAREARRSGHALLALVTRPVLDASEIDEGVPLPTGAAGKSMELACGAAWGAAPYLGSASGSASYAVSVGLESSPAARRRIGVCTLEDGVWTAVEVKLPDPLSPGERLFVGDGTDGGGRASELVQWSRPRVLPDPDPERLNLILISLDTLRADHLGAYGYTRPVSPSIDRMAREGTLFERAISQAPWTTPSHMSLFTSQFPTVHGVDAPSFHRQRQLAADKRTLAAILSDAGYLTAAFTGSGSISALFGFWRGFDFYDETSRDDPAHAGEDIAEVFDKASRWLVAHSERPFFMFFHSYEAHAPFTHGTFLSEASSGDAVSGLTALYDGDILFADGFIGQLRALVDGLGLTQRTVFALVSDHGEELAPRYPGRRLGHGHTVYDELLHVPLVIVAPGRVPAGVRVHQTVQLIDVMPTLLELLHLPVPRQAQGKSLAGVFRGEPFQERGAFAEATNSGPERKTIQEGRLQYIRTFPRTEPPTHEILVPVAEEELFDLEADPAERRASLPTTGPAVERLRAQLQAIVQMNAALRGVAPEQELDEETLRRLKALGYVQ